MAKQTPRKDSVRGPCSGSAGVRLLEAAAGVVWDISAALDEFRMSRLRFGSARG